MRQKSSLLKLCRLQNPLSDHQESPGEETASAPLQSLVCPPGSILLLIQSLTPASGDEIADVNKKLELLSETIQDLVQGKQNKIGTLNGSPNLLAPPRDDSPSTSEAENLYEGDTSFIAQSRLIAETLGSAFQNSPQALENGPRSAATPTIHRLLQELVSFRSPLPNPSSSAFAQYSDLASLPLLPSEAVLKLLRWAKGMSTPLFLHLDCDR